jgi:hypothetical protein
MPQTVVVKRRRDVSFGMAQMNPVNVERHLQGSSAKRDEVAD